MFAVCTGLPNSKETKLGMSNQKASPSTGKNDGVVGVTHHAWKCFSTAISDEVDISEVPGCQLLRVLCEINKNYFKDWCLNDSQSTYVIFIAL